MQAATYRGNIVRTRYTSRHQKQGYLNSPLNRYFEHGNSRPSQEQLESSIDQLSRRDTPEVVLVMADMCLDLAILDGEHAPEHIDTATGALTDTIDQFMYLRQRGYAQSAKSRYAVIQAQLRLVEMPNWLRAATGQPLENSYESLLQTALAVEPAGAEDQSRSKLVEFIPLLLGARAIANNQTTGWLGRLGLSREERKGILPSGANPNWDTGLLGEPTPDEFSSPSIKTQIKAKNSSSTQYRNAGVIPLSSRSLGFGDPAQVIFSCADEVDMLPPLEGAPFALLTSKQLNRVTKNIYDRTH